MPWDYKKVQLDTHDYLPVLRQFVSLQFLAEMIEMFPMEVGMEKMIDETCGFPLDNIKFEMERIFFDSL
jgi:hypothetical protein